MKNKHFIILACVAILAGRFYMHAPNFSPVLSILLFVGALTPKRQWFWPLIFFALTDLFFGAYNIWVMVAVYASLLVSIFIGHYLQTQQSLARNFGASLWSAMTFFVFTNLAVWLAGSWYPHTVTGLRECFVLALPFFRNTLMSNIFYSLILFALHRLVIAAQNLPQKIKNTVH